MRFVIVTGMSGAGKSTALKILEDEGYFCADNLPIPLVEKFADLAFTPEREYNKVALGVDIRSGREIVGLQSVLEGLTFKGLKYEILYLDARDEVLVKRYKETRRSHPLARSGRLEEGVSCISEEAGGLYSGYLQSSDPGAAGGHGQDFCESAGV